MLGFLPVPTVQALEARRLMSVSYLSPGSQATYNSNGNLLTVTGPTVFIADPGSSAPNVTASGSAARITLQVASGSQVHLQSLTLSSGATVVEPAVRTTTVEVAGALSIDQSSTFDVGSGDLVVSNGNLSQITALAARGFNLAGGANWLGTGITSAAAASDSNHLTAVGVVPNSSVHKTSFDADQALGQNDILVSYAYFGDANLDGKANGSDYSLIDSAFTSHGTATGWYNGDFNYDGSIDGSDYTLIDNAFNDQSALGLRATTYYVSPTGSDQNDGLSTGTPWKTVTKVDATTFQPGDQILFQYGGTWNGSLDATSNGTAALPITYSAYGNSALGKPVFSGSDVISNSAFTGTTGTSTHTMVSTTPVNWVFDNHTFTREAQDATLSADPTTDINFVNSTAGSFYFNSANNMLYVNVGGALTGHTISLATRVDAVFNNLHSYITFDNLASTETADDNSGYGFRVQNGTGVTIENGTATSAGKHSFGVIDGGGFVGLNLTAVNCEPDLGFGGASGFVSFSDVNTATINSGGDVESWQNITFINSNGPYEAMVSHGDANSIGSLTITNLISNNGYGSGVDIETTSPNEKVLLNGGQIGGGSILVNATNAIINGITFTGAAEVNLTGTHEVVQNCLFNGSAANVYSGDNGEIVDAGSNNTIRFNTFYETSNPPSGPAVGIRSGTTNTTIVDNVFADPWQIGLEFDGATTITSNNNAFTLAYATPIPSHGQLQFSKGSISNQVFIFGLPAWTAATGQDTSSPIGTFNFVSQPAGNFALVAGSFGSSFTAGPLDPTLAQANALLTPNSAGRYDAGVDYN